MPTYVTLFRYTAEGFKDLSEARRQHQISLLESHGGQGSLWTDGRMGRAAL